MPQLLEVRGLTVNLRFTRSPCPVYSHSMKTPGEREQLDRVRERFTRTADAFANFSLGPRRTEAAWLVELAAPQSHEVSLDVACGPGTFARAFAPRVRRACGLDLTVAMLERARRVAADEDLQNLFFTCGNAYALPFADGTFDLASCGYSLHHMSDPLAILRELARVVRPGGRVALLDLIAPEEPERAALNNRIEIIRDHSHVRTLSASEFERLLGQANFELSRREVKERLRSFDDWMQIAGFERGDPAYARTRELMEATIRDDTAGFYPCFVGEKGAGTGSDSDLRFTQTSLFLVAKKK
jgi:ubiquinone/menaquinone biosynthesis C-methylase UbiE